jgi:hypothetical protein
MRAALVVEQIQVVVPANRLEDVHGGEVCYNAEMTPWFRVTGDLQAINPGPQA